MKHEWSSHFILMFIDAPCIYLFHVFTLLPPPLPLFSSFKELKWSSELISSRLYKPLNRFCSSKQTIIQYPTNKQTNSRARKQTVHYVVFIQYIRIYKYLSGSSGGNYKTTFGTFSSQIIYFKEFDSKALCFHFWDFILIISRHNLHSCTVLFKLEHF